MGERIAFPSGDDDVDIIANEDGSLIIEAVADYGDSYAGWGSTCKTISMDREQVRKFRDFLNRALEWPLSALPNGER